MDEDNLLIICRSCGRKVLMHNMKPDGDNMICVDCYSKKSGVKNAKSIFTGKSSSNVSNTPFDSPTEKVSKTVKSEKMLKYICTSCKYKFSRKSTQEVSKCPYCGKSSIVFDSALGAEKILQESTDKKFEW